MGKVKLTKKEIENNTFYSEKRYEELKKRIEKYEKDEYKETRLEQKLCKSCCYLASGIAGQGFTSYACKECGNKHEHHNTNTPRYCKICAKTHHICVKCGSSL